MNFYKIILVMEAENMAEAEAEAGAFISSQSNIYDIWYKDIEDMSDEEILDFFGRTKADMILEDG